MDDLLTQLNQIQLPDTYPYLMAILGLVFIWKFHEMQVKAGRIKAKDIFERSGVRLFLCASPGDAQACLACKETANFVFTPAEVASKKFKAHEKPCTNPAGCRCIMVGLYGGWTEAREAIDKIKKAGGRIRLSDGDMKKMIEGASQARAGASADRMSLRMLAALQAEGGNPEVAIENYRYIISRAEEDRDLPFMIPSFLRLSELLEKAGKAPESLEVVEQCLRDYGEKKKGPDAPSETQRAALKTRQSLLAAKVNK